MDKRAKNCVSTQIKPGEGGRPKGAKNRMPPISLISEKTRAVCLKKFEAGINRGDPDYVLWLMGRIIPPVKHEHYVSSLNLTGIDLGELEGVKQASIRIIQLVEDGELSVEESILAQKMLENQHGFIFSDMVDFLMKHMNKIKNNPEFVGSGQTMTEEQFLELEALAKNNSNNQQEK